MKVLEMPTEYSTNSDSQLLALYLNKDKEHRAHGLISVVGGLRQIIEMSQSELVAHGLSTLEAQRIRAIREVGARFVAADISRGDSISSADKATEYLKLKLRHLEQEVFGALWLDTRNRVIAWEELFIGTLNEAAVYPRDVVKSAINHGAARVIFSHNHPSGLSEPSPADIALTDRLKEVLGFLDIDVLDHIIVGDDCCSMTERGWR